MKELAIQAENISKQYRLGQVGTGTITHDLNRFWHKVRGKENPYLKIGEANDRTSVGDSDYVWSLRDINFEIEQGEAVGIIGRNGAGKSTLLKLLSKVTKPTTGSFKVNGRIASLLEVGTGFNPEMTGRENIYLNGAILGMRRAEITRKFDEIVAFSGVERYIDTPVKRYSSGMYVRLAFAVAAHLESEILIIDEVLAVGDAEFQKKCLGKMGDVSKGEGRTVLFVSHNMAAISSLCNKGIYLKNGKIELTGNIETLTTEYLATGIDYTTYINDFSNLTIDKEFFEPIEFGILNSEKRFLKGSLKNSCEIELFIKYKINKLTDDFNFGIAVYDLNEQLLFWSLNTDSDLVNRLNVKIGVNEASVIIPPHFLNEGEYIVELIASRHFKYWILEPNHNAPRVQLIIEGGLSNSEFWLVKRKGILAPILKYK
jgi:lipopolysaccharide transport system ATP-binding protein